MSLGVLSVFHILSPIASMAALPTPSLKLTMLEADSSPRCLDGTGTGYYSRLTKSSTEWVVFLEGGSMCFDEADCSARKRSHLGSSKYWGSTLEGERAGGIGLLSDDRDVNPFFHDFNHLYIPYCSGDVFVGRQGVVSNCSLPTVHMCPWRMANGFKAHCPIACDHAPLSGHVSLACAVGA